MNVIKAEAYVKKGLDKMLCCDFGDDYIKIRYFNLKEGEKKFNSIKKRIDKLIEKVQQMLDDSSYIKGIHILVMF